MTPGPAARDDLRDAARRHGRSRRWSRRSSATRSFLRGEIAQRVNLKFAPEIRFRVDERFDEAERIEKILRTPEVQARSRDEARRRRSNERAEPRFRNRRAPGRAAGKPQHTAREARRAWLDRARQAGRHDLDPAVARGQAAVHGQARRPCRHARSARLRAAADRARRSDQDRSVRDGRAQALPLHGALGRGARHRRRRGPGRRRRPTARPTAEAISAALPALYRHDRAGAAEILRDQDRRRARL